MTRDCLALMPASKNWVSLHEMMSAKRYLYPSHHQTSRKSESGQIIICHQPRFPWNSRWFPFINYLLGWFPFINYLDFPEILWVPFPLLNHQHFGVSIGPLRPLWVDPHPNATFFPRKSQAFLKDYETHHCPLIIPVGKVYFRVFFLLVLGSSS